MFAAGSCSLYTWSVRHALKISREKARSSLLANFLPSSLQATNTLQVTASSTTSQRS